MSSTCTPVSINPQDFLTFQEIYSNASLADRKTLRNLISDIDPCAKKPFGSEVVSIRLPAQEHCDLLEIAEDGDSNVTDTLRPVVLDFIRDRRRLMAFNAVPI